jgi:hypothetical protein
MLFFIFMLLSAGGVAIASSVVTVTVTETQCPTSSPSSGASTPVATVKNGSYSGLYSSGYNQDFFLGIPYAQVGFPEINVIINTEITSASCQ